MNQVVLDSIFQNLLDEYKPQGWWPLTDLLQKNSDNDLKQRGYHPGDYSASFTSNQRFEICIGAILTQNTTWNQVEKIIMDLKDNHWLNSQNMDRVDVGELKQVIMPCGYYNQKALRIKEFTEFFIQLGDRLPDREELLKIWGIGPETADSILLYAFNQPYFVVDAYLNRILSRVFNQALGDYNEIQDTLHQMYEGMERVERVAFFNEFHSLLVVHGKNVCQKRPNCLKCVLVDLCNYNLIWSANG